MDNRLKPESKKRIIKCAYAILQRDGIEEFSIRKVASECGVSPAGIYRHFSSRDELLVYASIFFLESYFKQLDELSTKDLNSLEKYFEIEKIFTNRSFSEPEIFYNLYFGVDESQFDDIFVKCFELIDPSPEYYFKYQFGKSFINGGLVGRNIAILELLYDEGYLKIEKEDLKCYNRIIVNMYRGFLDAAITKKRNGLDTYELASQYLQSHRLLTKGILRSDVNIDC